MLLSPRARKIRGLFARISPRWFDAFDNRARRNATGAPAPAATRERLPSSPAQSEPRGPAPARVGAPVTGTIGHVGVLQAGLKLQLVAVRIEVRADIRFAVVVATAAHELA